MPARQQQDSTTAWRIAPQTGYVVDTTGSMSGAGGAKISARSASTDVTTLSVSKSMPADSLRLRRIKFSGRMKTQDVQRFASLWLRVDGNDGMLALDNGVARGLKGSNDWTVFEVTAAVPQRAARIVFGVLLSGTGSVDVEGLTITTISIIDPKAPIADAPKQLLNAAINTVQANSVWRDTVTWKVLLPEVRELAAGAQQEADVYPAIQYLVRRLGDGHSGFFPPVANTALRSGGAANPIPEVRVVDGKIGYIRMEGYSGTERTAMIRYSNTVHAKMLDAAQSASCGWIIDIRGNGGGNMNPMLSALRPFLGEGRLGYFISPTNRSEWSAKGSGDNWGLPRQPRELDDLAKQPVAVLTGPRTASSGEIVAISFRGRARTRSFGLPTAGLSTANSMFPLPGGSMINLTTAIDADRNGVRFGHEVTPDERIESPVGTDADPAISAASAWLRRESKCTSSSLN